MKDASQHPRPRGEVSGEHRQTRQPDGRAHPEGSPPPLTKLTAPAIQEHEEEERGRDGGALFRQQGEGIEKHGREQPEPLSSGLGRGKTDPGVEEAEGEDGRQRFAASHEARHGFDVHGVQGEEQAGERGLRRPEAGGQEERAEEERRDDVEQKVHDVKGHRVPAVDPPLRGVGEQQDGPVVRARPAGAAEVLRREEPGDVFRSANPRVVPDDRLVVVGERSREAVGEHRQAGEREQECPRRPVPTRGWSRHRAESLDCSRMPFLRHPERSEGPVLSLDAALALTPSSRMR